MASLMEKVTRLAITGLSLYSSERAGRLAFRIFSAAPPRKPASPKERAALERAMPRMQDARRVRLLIEGGEVSAFAFSPDSTDDESEDGKASRVLLVHGYRSRTEHMLAIVDALTAKGCFVVSLDLPGHGASNIGRFHLANSVEAVDAAWREFGPFETMVGHSFGGAAVMASAAGAIEAVPARCPERIVTIAAPTRLQPMFDWFSARMKLNMAVRTALEEEVKALTGQPLPSFDAARHLAQTCVTALVIHAPDDKEVSFDNAERLAGAGAHVTLFRAEGHGHRRILGAAAVLGEISRFAVPEPGSVQSSAMAKEIQERRECMPAPNARRFA